MPLLFLNLNKIFTISILITAIIVIIGGITLRFHCMRYVCNFHCTRTFSAQVKIACIPKPNLCHWFPFQPLQNITSCLSKNRVHQIQEERTYVTFIKPPVFHYTE